MKSPVRYFGGKGAMSAKLVSLLPPHKHYVEVFAGGASLFFAKTPAGGIEVLNDLDENIVNFYRILRDKEKFERLRALIECSPYSRAEYYECRDKWGEEDDDVERARMWFVIMRQSFSGDSKGSWSFAVSQIRRGMAGSTSQYLSAIQGLPLVHARLRRAQIECADFRDIIKTYDAPETLLYCDPPYLPETRSAGGYAHEMTGDDHQELIDLLLAYPRSVLLSGYANPLYARLESAGWNRKDFLTACHATGKTRAIGGMGDGGSLAAHPRTESVWLRVEGGQPRMI